MTERLWSRGSGAGAQAPLLHLSLYAVLATAIAWLALNTPVLHDGWGHFVRHLELGDDLAAHLRFYAPAAGNPRIGQALLLISYFDFPVHMLLATTFTVLLFLTAGAHILGRWPRLKSPIDTFAVFCIAALVFWCAPHAGEMFFYRPFLTNYVYGLTFTLLALLPLRTTGALATDWRFSPAVFLAGALGGMSNEHTGPAAIAIFAAAFLWRYRQSTSPTLNQLVGAIAFTSAYLYLFFAPGQSARYEGLATKTSLFDNVWQRGWVGNLWILIRAALPYTTTLTILVIVLRLAIGRGWFQAVSSSQRVVAFLMLLAAQAIALTTLASPITGDRLSFASTTLGLMAAVVVLVAALSNQPRRTGQAMLVAAATAFAFLGWCLPIYQTTHNEFQLRAKRLLNQRDRDLVLVAPYTHWQRNHFFYGDDLINPSRRAVVAKEVLTSGSIELRGQSTSSR